MAMQDALECLLLVDDHVMGQSSHELLENVEQRVRDEDGSVNAAAAVTDQVRDYKYP